ncbi:hypothetical protein A1O1_06457 [Capronia coronata CBS 617.96]|uniref:Uncharacterized protein n=1 Tax=Capronia coronata CBS 617.96 TaxID=1182541 RepID=W9Y0S4_9EURO|nr:uncharacterized protein A1O1_06457 [Capronia coronata CBS 617.96]EXJ86088.1 hypothetical protein A1O1_06457 [Capronia coronata CBS 617.96]
MDLRVVQVLLLIFSFVLALFLLIASSKYAAWAKVMTAATGSWLSLVFYVGAIPLMSLVYATAHLAALQFNGLPTPPYLKKNKNNTPSPAPAHEAPYDPNYGVSSTMFILGVSVLHFLAWLAQSILCTSCELAPILAGTQGRVPRWCPQSRFKDIGTPGLANMLGTLATVKDVLEWGMVLLTILLIECARREYMRAVQVQHEAFLGAGAGVDFGGRSRGFDGADSKKPGVAVELSAVEMSGPKPVTSDGQDQGQGQEQGQADAQMLQSRRDELEHRGMQKVMPHVQERENKWLRLQQPEQPFLSQQTWSRAPIQPQIQDWSDGKDNGTTSTGLQRNGTLNHMYESRV